MDFLKMSLGEISERTLVATLVVQSPFENQLEAEFSDAHLI